MHAVCLNACVTEPVFWRLRVKGLILTSFLRVSYIITMRLYCCQPIVVIILHIINYACVIWPLFCMVC